MDDSVPRFFNGYLDELEIYNEVIEPFPIKTFILSDEKYKRWKSNNWIEVSTTPPSKEDFLLHGMNRVDLSALDRQPTTFTIPMDDNTPQGQPLGNGKVFKEKLNLKKYIEINSINVK
ncbi:hypothetical protein D3C77_619540 [compost metagenome]